MDMENGLWGKLNRISGSLDTLRTSLHLSDDASIEDLAHLENLLNIYVQEEEPERKEGIWLKTSKKDFIDVVVDNNAVVPGILYSNHEYGKMPWNLNAGAYLQANSWSFAIVGKYLYGFGTSSIKQAYKYDTETQEFIQIANHPWNPAGCAVVTYDTDIYFFGGPGKGALKYDTLLNTYTTLPDVPSGNYRLFGISGCRCGDYIYIFGGAKQDSGAYGCCWDAYKFDVNTKEYTAIPFPDLGSGAGLQYPHMARSMFTSVVPFGNKIFMFGGRYSDIAKGYCIYDIEKNTWGNFVKVPAFYDMCPPAVVGTKVYFFSEAGKATTIDMATETISEVAVDIPSQMGRNGAYFIKDKIFIPYNDVLYVLTVKGSEYENNSVILAQNDNTALGMPTELITVPHFINRMRFRFSDAFYYSKENGIDATIPTYYGDGTQWIKFKN